MENKTTQTNTTGMDYEPVLAVAFYSYLPYKPMVVYPDSNNAKVKAYLTGICECGNYYETTYKRKRANCKGDIIGRKDNIQRGHECYIENMKLALVPLEKLKNINSVYFQGMNCDLQHQIEINEVARKFRNYNSLSVVSFELCLKNHIDIFDLIPNNLAVAI